MLQLRTKTISVSTKNRSEIGYVDYNKETVSCIIKCI